MAGISIWQLVIILVIIVLLFGTKKLKNIGGDLGSAVKGFKKAVSEEDAAKEESKEAEKLEQAKTQTKDTETTKEKDQA